MESTCTTLFLLFFFFLLHCTTNAKAQTPAAPAAAPAPPGPTNVTAILEKAGQYTTFIRLLKNTQIANQINNQLNNSNPGAGLTLFAPTDSAFSALAPGTLNSLTDQQKVALIQFHVLPTYIPLSQFQTASNPLRTQAGDSREQYPLNVTTGANNQVNISTGIVNATVGNSVYSDGELAVYQVDQVLLPLQIFRPAAPAPAPAAKPKKSAAGKRDGSDTADGPASDAADDSADASGGSGSGVLDRMRGGGLVGSAALAVAAWGILCSVGI